MQDARIYAKSYSLKGHGLEIETWSDLPVGSGMGTSSILAGCVLAALWTAVGTSYSLGDLNHAVRVLSCPFCCSLVHLVIYFI